MSRVRAAVVGVGYLGRLPRREVRQPARRRAGRRVSTSTARAPRAIAERVGAPSRRRPSRAARPDRLRQHRGADAGPLSPSRARCSSTASTCWSRSRSPRRSTRGARLVALAAAHGRILQVGHLERFNPAIRSLAGILTAAALHRVPPPGAVRRARHRRRRDPRPHDPRPRRHPQHRRRAGRARRGGRRPGALRDRRHRQRPPALRRRLHRQRHRQPRGAEARAQDPLLPGRRLRLGRLRRPLDAHLPPHPGSRRRRAERSTSSEQHFSDADPLFDEIEAFVDAVRTRTTPLVDGATAVRALEVAERIRGRAGERMSGPLRVLLVAGEASGDLHGAALVARAAPPRAATSRWPASAARSCAPPACSMLVDTEHVATMGFVETFGTLGRLLRTYRRLVPLPRRATAAAGRAHRLSGVQPAAGPPGQAARHSGLLLHRPAGLGLAPRPGPHDRRARRQARRRLPVRARALQQRPAAGRVRRPSAARRRAADAAGGRDPGDATASAPNGPCSRSCRAAAGRRSATCCAPMCEAAARLAAEGWQPVIALAPSRCRRPICRRRSAVARCRFPSPHDDTYNVVAAADAAIVASGTATLETALLGCPMVIVYRMSPLTFWIARRLVDGRLDRHAEHHPRPRGLSRADPDGG